MPKSAGSIASPATPLASDSRPNSCGPSARTRYSVRTAVKPEVPTYVSSTHAVLRATVSSSPRADTARQYRGAGGATAARPAKLPRVDATLHEGPLDALLPEWGRLYARHPEATPFMSPGWAAAWWPHYAGDAKPLLLCVRDGGELVGLAPLVIRRKGPLRVMEPVGMEPGDYWEVVSAPEKRDAVA